VEQDLQELQVLLVVQDLLDLPGLQV